MRRRIRLTEGDLKQIVKKSVNKVLNEAYGTMNAKDSMNITRLETPSYRKKEWYNGKHPFYHKPYKDYDSGVNVSPEVQEFFKFKESLFNYFNERVYGNDEYYGDVPKSQPVDASSFIYRVSPKYWEAINKHVRKLIDLCFRVENIYKMKLGQQPDRDYDWDCKMEAPRYGEKIPDDNVRLNASKNLG